MKLFDAVRLILTTRLSDRQIAASLSMSKTTVHRYRALAKDRHLRWESVQTQTPAQLARLFNRQSRGPAPKRAPDYAAIQKELLLKRTTLQLLWEEYRVVNPGDALSYAQFTALYRAHIKRQPRVMRQNHVPGERVFVDYSGKRPHYIDPATGEAVTVELFVAVLGASNYLYATCTHSQTVPDWIAAHVGMFDFFGGVPAIVVPDNLKSAVIKTGPEPKLQRTYQDLARHYGVAIMPARPRRPKDKGKVEVGVQIVQRWILARLRHQTFFSLDELNAAVAALLIDVNQRPFKKLPGCRQSRFEEIDKPALRRLPPLPYVYAEWVGKQTVPADYHIPVQGHFYSVPHSLVGEKVESRITANSVELLHNHRRVATHARNRTQGGHTTVFAHQPAEHRAQADHTPERLTAWGATVGPHTHAVVRRQFERSTPALGIPACASMRRLAEKHGTAALERAAQRAVELRSLTLTSVKTILRHHLRQAPKKPPTHAHLRGAPYYKEDRPC